MANTIATTSFATPTEWTTDTKVAIASDGTAFVLWCDGTNIKYSIASSPYSSWTTSNLTTGIGGGSRWAGSVYWDSGTDNLLVVSTDSGNNANVIATPFAKSGANWTKGTSHTVATGVVPYQGSAMQILKDGQGRYWCAVQPGTANTYVYVYLSTDGGVTWSQSVQSNQNLSGAIIPAMAIVGNFLTLMWGNGNVSWQRLDVSGVSLGAWSAVFTDGTNFVDNVTNSNAFFAFNGGAKGMFAYTYSGGGGPGTYAFIYDPVGNSVNAATKIQSGANQGQATLMPYGADIYALYTVYSAANNYSLVYKKYTSGTTTWDTNPTTVEAAGANIQWPNGVINSGTAYFVYTTGTANPFTLNFDTLSVVTITTNTHTSTPTTVALAISRGSAPTTVALSQADITHPITSVTVALALVRASTPTTVSLLQADILHPSGPTTASFATVVTHPSAPTTVTLSTSITVTHTSQPTTVALLLQNIQHQVLTNTVTFNFVDTHPVAPVTVSLQLPITRPVAAVDVALSQADILHPSTPTTAAFISQGLQRQAINNTFTVGGPPTRQITGSTVALSLANITHPSQPTTVALSQADIVHPSAPTTVALLTGLVRTVGTNSVSLIDPTTIVTYYGTNVAGTTLTASDQLTATGGGSSTVYTTGTETFNYTGWIELTPQGGTQVVHGAIGTPDGHGWFLDNTSYENSVIHPSSNWFAYLTLKTTAAQSGTITFRAYRMHWDQPTLTPTYPQQIFSYTTPTINFVIGDNIIGVPEQTVAVDTPFGAGDKLYVDIWYNQTSGGTATSTTSFKVASGPAGIPFLFEFDVPAIITSTLTRPSTPTTVALLLEQTHPSSPTTVALSGPIARPVAPVTTALNGTFTHTVTGSTVSLALGANTAAYYGTDQADIYAGVGNGLTHTGGNSTSTYTTGNQTFNFAGWMQILAHGGVTGVHGAIGAPDGHGWWLNAPPVDTVTPAGNWSGSFIFKCDAAQTGTMTIRIYRGNWVVGTATESFPENIVTYTTGTINFAVGDNTINLPATAASAITFASNDYIYIDFWYNQASGGTASSLTYVKVAQGTTGEAGVFEIDAPTNLQTHTHQIAFTAAFNGTFTHPSTPTTGALLATLTHPVGPNTLSMTGIAQLHTVAPTTMAVNGTFAHHVIPNAVLAWQRGVPTTVSIAGTPPMPIISNHLPVSSFASSTTYAATNANDTNYASIWRSVTVPSVAAPQWVAYDLSSQNPTKVLVNLINELGGQYYQTDGTKVSSLFADYTIDLNTAPSSSVAAPTSGWVNAVTVTGNVYTSRTHYVDMTGYNWIRMQVTASTGPAPNNDVLFQMDVHDASRGQEDTWLFLGDSITNEGSGHHNITGTEWGYGGSINQKVFAMTEGHYNPATIDAGWGGQTMTGAALVINNLDVNFTGGFVVIALGTNDCNQPFQFSPGDANVGAIYNALLTIIDNFTALPQSPTIIVPYIPYGQNNGGNLGFNANLVNQYVDANLLINRPAVLRGPDMWTFFNNNPTLIRNDSGVQIHPTYLEVNGQPSGYEWWQKLWVNWMATNVYSSPVHPVGPNTAALSLEHTRQIGTNTVSLVGQRGVPLTATIQQTVFTHPITPATVALSQADIVHPSTPTTAAIKGLDLTRPVAPLTVSVISTFTHPSTPTTVAFSGLATLKQITSVLTSLSGTFTHPSAPTTVSLLGVTPNTHPSAPTTVALSQADIAHPSAPTTTALSGTPTHPVTPLTVSLQGVSVLHPSTPTTVALQSLGLTHHALSMSVALVLTFQHPVAPNSVTLASLDAARHITSVTTALIFANAHPVAPVTAALLVTISSHSVIPSAALSSLDITHSPTTVTVALVLTPTHPVSPNTTALSQSNIVHPVTPLTVSLQGTNTNNHPVTPTTAALSQADIRHTVIPTASLAFLDVTHTVASNTTSLYFVFTHQVGASTTLVSVFVHPSTPTTATLLATETHQVIPNMALSAANVTRTVSTVTVALGSFNQTHPSTPNTVTFAATLTHEVFDPTVSLVSTFTRPVINSSVALRATLTHTLTSNSVAIAPAPRLVTPTTAALISTLTRHCTPMTAALGADVAELQLGLIMPGRQMYLIITDTFGY